MKPYLSTGLLLFILPTWSVAADHRPHPAPLDAPAAVLPVTADLAEPRNAIRLRDALRQPYEDVEDDKPYRMPAGERQRMREQLRSQSFYDPNKK